MNTYCRKLIADLFRADVVRRAGYAVLTIVGVFCTSTTALASGAMPMHFSHILLDDGLSQNNVQSILQDSQGYMWFATESGLNRYDGYTIHQYLRERGNPNALSNDHVWVVREDKEQNLWLATEGGGVVRWNRASDTFTSFRHDAENSNSLASDEVRTLIINADGTLWVGTRDQGLDLLNPRTGQVRHYRHDPADATSLSDNMVYALHVDSKGDLWVGTDGGANRLIAGSDSFVRYQNDPANEHSLSNDRVRAIFEDHANNLWIGTSGGLNRLHRSAAEFARMQHDPADSTSLSNDHVRVIFEDDERRLWVGTTDGLNLVERETGSVHRYQHNASDPQSLNDSHVNSIAQDKSGLLWVGTRSAGVSNWNPRSWSFGHIMQPWLSGSDVTSFAATGKGEVWIGTLGAGLARFDERTETVERIPHRPEDPASISDDAVMSLLLDRQGMLWVGTMSGGLNRMDPSNGEVRTYRHDEDDPNSLAADGVMAIYEDAKGQLWIGTYAGGVSVFDRSTESFRHYAHDPEDLQSLSDPRASAIAESTDGSIWIGTFGGGLNLLDPDTGKFQRFQSELDDPASISDNTIFALHRDVDGKLWIGTQGGLDLVVESEAAAGEFRFINYSRKNGLPSSVVYGVQSDSSNRLWLSTNYGITRFDLDTFEMKTFHQGQGLQGEEFNYGAHHRSPNGTLYFGGANGYNAFRPEDIAESTYSPEIVLTSYQKLNEPVPTDIPYDRLTKIELDHADDVVNFGFSAMDFTAPDQNTYSYTLGGFDDGWIDLGTKRHITYTNLDAGNYLLMVKAVTSDGVPSAGEFSIPVIVAPAPWKTAWAYSLYAAVILLLLWLGWRSQQSKYQREAEYSRRLEQDVAMRTEQLEERNNELQVASSAKSDFLARMSHEIRTPMNGMLGMTQLLMGTDLDDKQYRFAQTVKRSAESLLEIINDVLDFSKIEAGRLELDSVEFDVSELVDETVELFSGAAAEKGLELMCATPAGRTVAAVGDPLRVKQILVNLLGNALKFTEEGEIVVRFQLLEEDSQRIQMRFEVSDTGIGVQPEHLALIFDSFSQEDGSTARRFGGTGLGLAICKQLIGMMGGEIGVDSEPGKGSCFWFTLSFDNAGPAWFSRNVSHRLANLNVLLVDDNATNSEIVTEYLAALGVNTDTASSGQSALQMLQTAAMSSPFDLVVLDSDVGDMSGLALSEKIKSRFIQPNVKVLLMNPAAVDLDEDQWQRAGIDDCLPKPIQQSKLFESLLVLTAATGTFTAPKLSRELLMDQNEPLNGRVLLVEDNPVNQAVAIGMLEELGCDTVVAANGQEALERVTQEEFDAILMDCEMPVMDGFSATAAIRNLASDRKNIPIIALTANAIAGDRERCIAAGMQDYVSKPISLDKLHQALEKWLAVDADTVDPASLDSIRSLRGVGGEKMVREVVDLYLESSSSLVKDLCSGLSQGDAEAVRQDAHALKSSSQNVGANALATLSQKLEEMGRSGELEDTDRYKVELDKLYPITVLALKAVVQQGEH